MKQYLVILGSLCVVAALAFVAFGSALTPNPDDDDDGGDWWNVGGDDNGGCDCTATCTMYVKDLTTGVTYAGDLSMKETTLGEAMMLSFGDGIRDVQLKPLQMDAGGTSGGAGGGQTNTGTSALWKDHAYAIWATVNFVVTGTNLKSIDSATIEFYGKAGTASSSSTPDHVTSLDDSLYCGGCGSSKVVVTKGSLMAGTSNTASNSDKVFNQVSTSSGKITLNGDRVDGALLTCSITVSGTDNAGQTVTDGAMGSLKFSAPNYQSSSINVEITSLNGGNRAA